MPQRNDLSRSAASLDHEFHAHRGHRDEPVELARRRDCSRDRTPCRRSGLAKAGKAVAARPHHGPPQLVQPGPGGLGCRGRGHAAAPGRSSRSLAGHEPNRQEPCPQRLAGPFEYRAGGYRGLPAACPAPQPATGHFPRLADNPTVWAAKTGRPAEPADIGAASNLIPKPLVQCLEGAWVVNARHRMPYGPHPSTISVAAGGMKGIPTCCFYVRPLVQHRERHGARAPARRLRRRYERERAHLSDEQISTAPRIARAGARRRGRSSLNRQRDAILLIGR